MDKEDLTYKNILSRLPNYRAPGEVWERLQVNSFHADLSSMPQYYPPTTLWKKIEHSKSKAAFQKKLIRWTYLLVLLAGFGIYGYFGFYAKADKPIGKQQITGSESSINNENASAIPTELTIGELNPIHSPLLNHDSPARIVPVVREKSSMSNVEEQDITYMMKRSPLFEPEDPDLKFGSRNENIECSPFYSTGDFNYSIGYGQQFFTSGDQFQSSKIKSWHLLELGVDFEKNRFNLSTGIGLGFSKDKNSWHYDYLKKELIDTYIYVDSVHYNPVTGETSYFTSYVEVYDSIPYSESKTAFKDNFYLQIPLKAGYNIYSSANFDFIINSGLQYSFLIKSEKIFLQPDEPDSKITRINFERTSRSVHLLNAEAGFKLKWRISSAASIYVSSSVNYYFTPLYLKSTDEKPVSFGIKAGLSFN